MEVLSFQCKLDKLRTSARGGGASCLEVSRSEAGQMQASSWCIGGRSLRGVLQENTLPLIKPRSTHLRHTEKRGIIGFSRIPSEILIA